MDAVCDKEMVGKKRRERRISENRAWQIHAYGIYFYGHAFFHLLG